MVEYRRVTRPEGLVASATKALDLAKQQVEHAARMAMNSARDLAADSRPSRLSRRWRYVPEHALRWLRERESAYRKAVEDLYLAERKVAEAREVERQINTSIGAHIARTGAHIARTDGRCPLDKDEP